MSWHKRSKSKSQVTLEDAATWARNNNGEGVLTLYKDASRHIRLRYNEDQGSLGIEELQEDVWEEIDSFSKGGKKKATVDDVSSYISQSMEDNKITGNMAWVFNPAFLDTKGTDSSEFFCGTKFTPTEDVTINFVELELECTSDSPQASFAIYDASPLDSAVRDNPLRIISLDTIQLPPNGSTSIVRLDLEELSLEANTSYYIGLTDTGLSGGIEGLEVTYDNTAPDDRFERCYLQSSSKEQLKNGVCATFLGLETKSSSDEIESLKAQLAALAERVADLENI